MRISNCAMHGLCDVQCVGAWRGHDRLGRPRNCEVSSQGRDWHTLLTRSRLLENCTGTFARLGLLVLLAVVRCFPGIVERVVITDGNPTSVMNMQVSAYTYPMYYLKESSHHVLWCAGMHRPQPPQAGARVARYPQPKVSLTLPRTRPLCYTQTFEDGKSTPHPLLMGGELTVTFTLPSCLCPCC